MQGWATAFSLFREASLFGSMVLPPLRPTGIASASIDRSNVASFSTRDVYGNTSEARPLFWSHTLAVTREFSCNEFLSLVLAALGTGTAQVQSDTPAPDVTTTTRRSLMDAVAPSFGAEMLMDDGTCWRLSGMTLLRVEWVIQSGRIVTENTSWGVLRIAEMEAGDMTEIDTELHRPVTALQARHALQFSTAAWTPTDHIRLGTFSTQIIIERTATPVQFTTEGEATRWNIAAGWDIVGKTMLRLTPAELTSMVNGSATGRMWWKLINPADSAEWLEIEIPRVRVQVAGQAILQPDLITHSVDFMSVGENHEALRLKKVTPDPAVPHFLLLETGGFFLLETGGRLRL